MEIVPSSTQWLPYGRSVKKVECCNHAVKCYRTRLEALVKDNPRIGGRGGLSKAMIVRIATGARSAIRYHSKTQDVAALRHDLRNGPPTVLVTTQIVGLMVFVIMLHRINLQVRDT